MESSVAHPDVTFWTTAVRVSLLHEGAPQRSESQLLIGSTKDSEVFVRKMLIKELGLKHSAESGFVAMPVTAWVQLSVRLNLIEYIDELIGRSH
jgi:hypothetical protein